MNDDEIPNFQVFRDCLAAPMIERSTENQNPKKQRRTAKAGRKTMIKPLTTEPEEANDAEELAEFIDYIAEEIFMSFPPSIRTLTYSTWFNSAALQTLYPDPLPKQTANSILTPLDPSITESLTTYNILPSETTLSEFLTPILTAYLSTVTMAPRPPSVTRDQATGCEICDRSWIPLTYHHLIPRQAHGKALKRGWHTEDQLNNVAWICRACHSFVHRVATNDDLAKYWYTVDKLLEREDVINFAAWVGRMRWKGR